MLEVVFAERAGLNLSLPKVMVDSPEGGGMKKTHGDVFKSMCACSRASV